MRRLLRFARCLSREQRGYMGDAGIYWGSAAFNMDVAAFTARQTGHDVRRAPRTYVGACDTEGETCRLENRHIDHIIADAGALTRLQSELLQQGIEHLGMEKHLT